MTISRRMTLAAPFASLLIAKSGFADDENQQIALSDPNEYILAASFEEARQKNVTEEPKSRGIIPPPYPESARRDGREGWVRLSMTVLRDGAVRDAAIDDAYPQKLFDHTVLNSAETFSFWPGRVNGEPRETRGVRINFTFIMDGARGVSLATYDLFKKALVALHDRHLEQAESPMAKLQEMKDKGKFNLTELAHFSELAARLAYAKGNWIESHENLRTMLSLSKFLDTETALENAYRLRLALQLHLNNFDQAVDYYDAVNRTYPGHLAELAGVVESYRSKGFGKGVAYELPTLQKLQGSSHARTPNQTL